MKKFTFLWMMCDIYTKKMWSSGGITVSDAEKTKCTHSVGTRSSANTCPIQRFHNSYRTHWYGPVSMAVAVYAPSTVTFANSIRPNRSSLTPAQTTSVGDDCLRPSSACPPPPVAAFSCALGDSAADTPAPRPLSPDGKHAAVAAAAAAASHCYTIAALDWLDSIDKSPDVGQRVADNRATCLSIYRRRVVVNWPIPVYYPPYYSNVDRRVAPLGAPIRPRT